METTKKQITETVPRPESPIIEEQENGIVRLTLNRPEKLNSLSKDMLEMLQVKLDAIAENRAAKLVIIQGAGKAFCSGHDLKEMIATRKESYYKSLFQQCSRMMMTLNKIPQPVIALVNGIATAAGCQLVGACDLAVASEDARFATSGINVGLFCSTPSVPISRNIPRKIAMELLLTGEFIDANTALKWGLINRIAPRQKLEEEVQKLADSILSKSSLAVFTGKKMFYKQLEKNMEDAYEFAGEIMACNMMAEDTSEGIHAFIKKRTAVWKGR